MLTYNMTDRAGASLYEHLYRCIRRDIETGVITEDERLPSKRSLAKHLGVSLITIEGAYSQLIAEGYLRSEQRRGYFANRPVILPQLRAASRIPACNEGALEDTNNVIGQNTLPTNKVTAEATALTAAAAIALPAATAPPATTAPPIIDLRTGNTSLELFPFKLWTRTIRNVLAHESERTLLADVPQAGLLRLRSALASYLHGSRGMDVEPEQIIVGAGAQYLYGLLIQLIGRKYTYAIETPGYPRLAKIYRANDVDVAFIPLDEQGACVDALRKSSADVVHLMPSHQFPTGLVTPIGRRYELLAWAAESDNRYLIEDDYDCEFRFAGMPIPALQSIDSSERVIYVNTFTKSLGATFRVGYLVLPRHLVKRFSEQLSFYSNTVSALDQLVLALFIENGDYERHVSRLRNKQRTLRDELISALKVSAIAESILIEREDAGLHFILGIESQRSDEELKEAFLREGLDIYPLSCYELPTKGYSERLSDRNHSAEGGPNEIHRFAICYGGIAKEEVKPVVCAMERAIYNI